ncbi:hypothetical protein BCR43DRAFT_515403 [Syncephalastrum racemosum]|uniref:Uncharacterized protein n=1 Tax=Syncephalastrum racemosum TaxID=13706 RepID=A0A1X2H9C5_SYNRA|nr:hypothetical protein BCR43DRAFT_515403 [Syncephalastrum racemosum]
MNSPEESDDHSQADTVKDQDPSTVNSTNTIIDNSSSFSYSTGDKRLKESSNEGHGQVKPSGSQSTPLGRPRKILDSEEQAKLTREISEAKKELLRFRAEMNELARQMDGMAIDIKDSKDRVCTYTEKLAEIEHDLTETQEAHVDLQVLLENALQSHKETDTHTTHIIRSMYSDLASIANQNNQMQDRLASLASHQKKHDGSVMDVSERMREYVEMLEQAQGTIHAMRPAPRSPEDALHALRLDSRRASDMSTSTYTTEDEEVLGVMSRKRSEMTGSDSHSRVSPEIAGLYRHRHLRKHYTPEIEFDDDSRADLRHVTSRPNLERLKDLIRSSGLEDLT